MRQHPLRDLEARGRGGCRTGPDPKGGVHTGHHGPSWQPPPPPPPATTCPASRRAQVTTVELGLAMYGVLQDLGLPYPPPHDIALCLQTLDNDESGRLTAEEFAHATQLCAMRLRKAAPAALPAPPGGRGPEAEGGAAAERDREGRRTRVVESPPRAHSPGRTDSRLEGPAAPTPIAAAPGAEETWSSSAPAGWEQGYRYREGTGEGPSAAAGDAGRGPAERTAPAEGPGLPPGAAAREGAPGAGGLAPAPPMGALRALMGLAQGADWRVGPGRGGGGPVVLPKRRRRRPAQRTWRPEWE